MSEGPIYITGLDRSGKTTMRAFLASHSRIAIPAVGSNMFMYFYGQFGDLSNPANLDRCLDAMLQYKHVVFLQPNEAAIRAQFAEGPPSYARLFGVFLSQFAHRHGKPRWGAQSGLEEQYAGEMFREYPGLKVIQMVRDPRDRYAASLVKWPDGRGRAGGAAARWSFSLRHAERNLALHPNDYIVVRFEDLIRGPEVQLRRVCEFLGEEFEESMLEMTEAAKHRDLLAAGSSDGAILSPDHIGIHGDVVPPSEQAYIELVLGARMRRWGYEPTIDRDALPRLWWVAEVPDQAVRGSLWRMAEETHRRVPRGFGRRPGSRMIVERVGT